MDEAVMEEVKRPENALGIEKKSYHRKRVSADEWFAISNALEVHHAVFYKIWQMGRPNFTDEIDTAAVQFDETGKFVWFHFNPQFWDRIDFYKKLFVICHEALHIILNHGIRTIGASKLNRAATNAALDIVVNHTLVNHFDFERDKIFEQEDYCWVDTVFAKKDPLPPDNESFEYYYNLFDKVYGYGFCESVDTVDDHSGLENSNWGKVIDELNKDMSDEEKNTLKGVVEKHHQKSKKDEGDPEKTQQAGEGTGGQWVFTNARVKRKKKWETVIKKWSLKFRPSDKEKEQWTRMHRRHSMLPKTLFLPSDMEVEEDKETDRIRVHFFLDTSGSCWHLKDRFFEAALSLPPERFDVRLFCFDTKVEETTLESRKVYGGGGTSFSILEQYIQDDMAKNKTPYPEAVFVITDGYGNTIKPQIPQKWYWFITAGGTQNYIDKNCSFFDLAQFE
jgi:hypothetical protein